MLLGFESNTIHMTVHLGVNNLRGSKKTNKMFYCKYFRDDIIVIKAKKCNHNFLVGTYEWGWTAMRGVLGRRGQLTFNLDFVNVEIRLQQSANLDKKPIVDSVNVTLGPTQLTSDGIGAVDYVLEMIFNVVPVSLQSTNFDLENDLVVNRELDKLRNFNKFKHCRTCSGNELLMLPSIH